MKIIVAMFAALIVFTGCTTRLVSSRSTSANPLPTPIPLSSLEAAQKAWNDCKGREIPEGIRDFHEPQLAGLVFGYKHMFQIDGNGQPTLISCLPLSEFSPSGRWLTFRLDKDVWVVDRETDLVKEVSNRPEMYSYPAVWSPDEQFFYYLEGNNDIEAVDIWAWNAKTGESRQVTYSSETREEYIQVWPAYPEWLVFSSWPPNLNKELGTQGYLTIIKTDGSNEQVLSHDTRHAFSPDGKTLAFRNSEGAWLLQPGNKPEPFLPGQFTIENWEVKSLSHPAWSPEGKKIAWSAVANNGQKDFAGGVVFDLSLGKAWFVHPFIPAGSGDGTFFPSFSPTGEWLVSYTHDKVYERQGIWIMRYDGSEDHFLGSGTSQILWNHTGDAFLYEVPGTSQVYRIRVGEWKPEDTGLPNSVFLVDWMTIKSP